MTLTAREQFIEEMVRARLQITAIRAATEHATSAGAVRSRVGRALSSDMRRHAEEHSVEWGYALMDLTHALLVLHKEAPWMSVCVMLDAISAAACDLMDGS